MKGSAQRIALGAMLVALSFVISLLPSLPGPITKFAGFPLLLGGMLVGPRTGFAVGCLTDLIGFAFRPTGPFFPGFTLSQGLTCMLPGLFTRGKDPYTWRDEKSEDKTSRGGALGSYLRLFLIFGVTQTVTSVLMVSVFRSKIVAGTPLLYELTTRSFAQATHVPVYALLAFAILKALSTTELYERLIKVRK
jgi:ECF transporter S component (folate family)